MNTNVLTSIRDADPKEWDDLVSARQASAFHSYAWLRAIEAAPPFRLFCVRHIEIRSAGRLQAVMPLFGVADDPQFLAAEAELGISSDVLRWPMLLCHSWYAFYSESPSRLPPQVLLDAVCPLVEQLAREVGARAWGFTALAPESPLLPELRRRGWRLPVTHGTARLSPQTEHLAAKQRSELGRRARRAEDAGYRVTWERALGRADVIADLVHKTCVRRGVPVAYPASTIHSVCESFDTTAWVVQLASDDAVAAASLVIEQNATAWVWITGVDDAMRSLSPYFVLAYEKKRWARERGLGRIEAGRGDAALKRRLGYQFVPLVTALRALEPSEDKRLQGVLDLMGAAASL